MEQAITAPVRSDCYENLGEDNITFTYARGPFCKAKSEIIKLICICRSPWIEGINCFGSEYSNFLQIFIHVWKFHIVLKCNSSACPIPNKERSQTTYSLQPDYPIEEQICSLFPCMGMNFGKCCSRFPDSPPHLKKEVKSAMFRT